MIADEQTHTLPLAPEELDRFARFLGYARRDAFAEALLAHLRAVESRYVRLFERAAIGAAERRGLVFPPDADAPRRSSNSPRWASAIHWKSPRPCGLARRRATWTSWRSGARAFRGIAAASWTSLHLRKIPMPRWSRSIDFWQPARRRAAVLMLRQNPDLVALVARVLGTAPRLADTLALHPEVLDPLIEPAFFDVLPSADRLAANLARSLTSPAPTRTFSTGTSVRTGADLSRRRAHSRRYGFRAAGGRGLRRHRRYGGARASPQRGGHATNESRDDTRGRNCDPRHGQARRPRNGGQFRPRSHCRL